MIQRCLLDTAPGLPDAGLILRNGAGFGKQKFAFDKNKTAGIKLQAEGVNKLSVHSRRYSIYYRHSFRRRKFCRDKDTVPGFPDTRLILENGGGFGK